MVDIALIVIACIVPCVLTFFNLLVMARYLDRVATAGHYTTKLLILLGMLLAECTILLLPLDVGNRAGVVGCGFWNDDCGGLNLALVWQIVYCIIFGLVVVIFPFFIFFYEADDEGLAAEDAARASGGSSCMARLCDFSGLKRSCLSATIYTGITCVLSGIALGVSYIYMAKTHIPYKVTSVSVASVAFMPVGTSIAATCTAGSCLQPCGTGTCNWASSTLEIDVTFVIYLAALMSFVGWFLFSIYVGIGFVALPIDCFMAFIHRPKTMPADQLAKERQSLRHRCEELIRLARDMGKRQIDSSDKAISRSDRRKVAKVSTQEVNRYSVLVQLLEADLEKWQMGNPEYYRKHFNPLVPFAKLLFGIIAVVLTLAWLIHILIYMLFSPPLDSFLNKYFTWFDQWFPLFGTISVAIFGLYLLLAAAKGNTKFGTRFFLIKVHPMEAHKTYLNAFLFNVALVLLCVLPAVQFCTDAFSEYSRLTDAQMIFSNQFKYMTGFRYFWQYNVFLFTILALTLLAAVYFAMCPSDRRYLNDVMAQIKASNKARLDATSKTIDRKGAGGAVEMSRVKGRPK